MSKIIKYKVIIISRSMNQSVNSESQSQYKYLVILHLLTIRDQGKVLCLFFIFD